MPPIVCSLILEEPQTIPSGGYHVVRFPFGSAESYDDHGMHQAQTTGYAITDWRTDDRSALIWPAAGGWADLTANIHWEPGNYTELRDQFVRDPLGYTSDPVNTTGTDHRPPSPGMQCFTKHHAIFVRPDVPIALRLAHNDSTSRHVVHAQFKLAIHT